MLSQVEDKSDAVRCFHPGWFASVMGTGIIAVATHHADAVVPGLETFAVVLWVLTAALFAVLIVPWTIRWIRYRTEAWADTAHPTGMWSRVLVGRSPWPVPPTCGLSCKSAWPHPIRQRHDRFVSIGQGCRPGRCTALS
jgi:tellurite resistance protein TehA-like permease